MVVETFVGLFILACISAYFFYRNACKVRFANASIALRAAFAPEIATLESPVVNSNIRDILIGAFDRHSEAAVNFRGNLNWFRKRRFNMAWKQYHSGHKFDPEAFGIKTKDRLFLDFFSIEPPEKPEETYLKRIHKILSYAKET